MSDVAQASVIQWIEIDYPRMRNRWRKMNDSERKKLFNMDADGDYIATIFVGRAAKEK